MHRAAPAYTARIRTYAGLVHRAMILLPNSVFSRITDDIFFVLANPRG